jgi:hypothetical protein
VASAVDVLLPAADVLLPAADVLLPAADVLLPAAGNEEDKKEVDVAIGKL